jgi:uncharacterized protein (TIGR00369 family)
VNLNEEFASLDGLGQMRAMIASGGQPPIAVTLDFRLVEVEVGRAVFEATAGDHALNTVGMTHGGYIATLLDSACGCAVHSSLSVEQAYTTLDLNVSYLRAIPPDAGLLRAEGKVLRMGRRAAFAEAALLDSSGRTLATATSTLLVFERTAKP